MNYSNIYTDLIQSAQLRPIIDILDGYTETHHILPRALGGLDSADNLVKLTPREHFIAHWLLWKIYKNTQYEIKMMYAFNMMRANKYASRYYNSRGFDAVKKAVIITQRGKPLSESRREKIRISSTGRKHTEETRKKMRDAQKLAAANRKPVSDETRKKMSETRRGKKYSAEHCQNISKSKTGKLHSEERKLINSAAQKGKKLSDETRKKMSNSHTGKKRSPEQCKKISEGKLRSKNHSSFNCDNESLKSSIHKDCKI